MQTVDALYDKEIKCEVCEYTYKTKKLRSRYIRTVKVHSDFYTEYKNPEHNPYLYEIYVCPVCGYAASEHFSHYFPPGAKEEIYTKITSRWKTRDYGGKRTVEEAIQTYKLAIFAGTIKKEKNVVLAGLALRLAWLYRMLGNKEQQEKRFLRLSLDYYEKAYEASDHIGTQMSDIQILYLIGELHRRVGNEEKAVQYFSRVIGHKNKAYEPKIVEMARERWYEMRNKESDEH